ncbi:MAG: pyridoxamine 5'-phosphate oxidase family protein [Cyclobacteriaceae bacterium]|nr:pyridoxamine 5'-phosphate oxidase family protein [Cyclobacteriaceae bacterium]
MLTPEVTHYIRHSVLCWLATTDAEGAPNVSPKEMFTTLDDRTLLIAHIASPASVRNLVSNPKVCVSFVDVFVQKGFKLKGTAQLVTPGNSEFNRLAKILTDEFTDRFPILGVIRIAVTQVQPILAPSYRMFPATTTEESQRAGAMETYGVRPIE